MQLAILMLWNVLNQGEGEITQRKDKEKKESTYMKLKETKLNKK